MLGSAFNPVTFWMPVSHAQGSPNWRRSGAQARPDTIAARYAARVGSRPVGHPGLDYVPELHALATRARPLDAIPIVVADTEAPLDPDALLRDIRAILDRAAD